VCVHDVRLLELQHLGQVVGKGGHVGPEVIFGYGRRRAGGHMYHLVAGRCCHPLSQVSIVTPGVDRDCVPVPDEARRQLGNVDVLAARVDATNGGQRAGVFRNQGYPHGTSPSF
jgi:hypothetical protein